MEAEGGIEPPLTALQAAASPLCHPAGMRNYYSNLSVVFNKPVNQKNPGYTFHIKPGFRILERETRLELATPTLARLCSTN